MKSLLAKLDRIRADHTSREFVIADARDADMAWGIASPGTRTLADGRRVMRTMPEFMDQIRLTVREELVDIMLASVSTMSVLAHRERLFEQHPSVTPAVRANDTTDVWCVRGGRYRESPSLPFATAMIDEVQFGTAAPGGERPPEPVVNLGLYSMTFNNDRDADRESLNAFSAFRAKAQAAGFKYFLEVFAPNVEGAVSAADVPSFVNDHIVRTLAGVPVDAWPLFLKIPYFGPAALEELVHYNPSIVVGVLGGGAGTTYDAFKLLADAQRYGARVALYGRKIKNAEDPLAMLRCMRAITDGHLNAEEAVREYHGMLERQHLKPDRVLKDDLQLTDPILHY